MSWSSEVQEDASVSRLSSFSEDHDPIPSGTGSSLSFAQGPGALAGKFIKWIGEISLSATVLVIIRGRLMIIKQAVRRRPHIFLRTWDPAEEREARRIHGDLKALCRKQYYPLVLRRKAARLVLEIAFLVYLKQFDTISELSNSLYIRATQEDPWDRWNTLLRLSNISSSNRFPLPTDDISENMGVGSAIAATAATDTISSGVTPSAFISEARTSATSFGPGSISRLTVLELGQTVLELSQTVLVRRILSRIKVVTRKRPHIFVDPKGTKEMQDVDYMYDVLQDLSSLDAGFHGSPDLRRKAARLILEIAVIISGPSSVITLDDNSNNPNVWLTLVTQPYVHPLLSVRPFPTS